MPSLGFCFGELSSGPSLSLKDFWNGPGHNPPSLLGSDLTSPAVRSSRVSQVEVLWEEEDFLAMGLKRGSV